MKPSSEWCAGLAVALLPLLLVSATVQAQMLPSNPGQAGNLLFLQSDPAAEAAAAKSRERLAYLDSNGTLWARSEQLDAWARTNKLSDNPWHAIASEVKSYQMSQYELVILKRTGELLWQQGDLTADFAHIDNDVATFLQSGRRVGLLTTDGTFKVSTISGSPTVVATGVTRFHIALDRIALLDGTDTLWASIAGTPGKFDRIGNHVQDFQIDREWLAYRREGDLFLGRARDGMDGAPYEMTVLDHNVGDMEMQAEGPTDFQSTRLRLAYIDSKGRVVIGTVGHLEEKLTVTAPDPVWTRISVKGPQALGWAGGTLFVKSTDGTLALVSLVPKAPQTVKNFKEDWLTVGVPTYINNVAEYSPSDEGALVTQNKTGSIFVYRGINDAMKNRKDAAVRKDADLGNWRDLPRDAGALRAGLRLELASERPWFTRRATAADSAPAPAKALVVLTP